MTEQITEFISVPASVVSCGEHLYAYRVMGRCMEKAGIYDGDYVVINPDIYPMPGDACECVVDGAKMIKRYDGKRCGVPMVATQYADRAMQGAFFAEEIRGVVCAAIAPDGQVRTVFDTSNRPTEPETHDTIRSGNCTLIKEADEPC